MKTAAIAFAWVATLVGAFTAGWKSQQSPNTHRYEVVRLNDAFFIRFNRVSGELIVTDIRGRLYGRISAGDVPAEGQRMEPVGAEFDPYKAGQASELVPYLSESALPK